MGFRERDVSRHVFTESKDIFILENKFEVKWYNSKKLLKDTRARIKIIIHKITSFVFTIMRM